MQGSVSPPHSCHSIRLIIAVSISRSIALTHVWWDTSTGNLQHHCNGCNSKVAPAGQGVNNFAHGSTYSPGCMRYLAALWVSQSGHPYVAIQNPDLLAIFCMLYGHVEVPQPTTLFRDVREIFEMTQQNVAKELQVCLQTYFIPLRLDWSWCGLCFTVGLSRSIAYMLRQLDLP